MSISFASFDAVAISVLNKWSYYEEYGNKYIQKYIY